MCNGYDGQPLSFFDKQCIYFKIILCHDNFSSYFCNKVNWLYHNLLSKFTHSYNLKKKVINKIYTLNSHNFQHLKKIDLENM